VTASRGPSALADAC